MLVAAALASCWSLAPADATTTLNYVAMGDSYSSVGTLLSPVPGSPPVCARDTDSYPFVTAKALGTTVTDVACGGATSASLSGSQHPGVPPQLAALDDSTDVVTIGIGGNDNSADPSDPSSASGFLAQAIVKCGSADLLSLWTGSPCKNRYQSQLQDEVAAEAPTIAADLKAIHAAAPHAAVFVVGYADILPQRGACFPSMPLSPGDVAFMNAIEQQLNAVIAAQAVANGATYVDVYAATIGHDACQPESNRWVEPLLPGTDAAPVHPNAAGQHAIGLLVAEAISARIGA